MPFKQCPIYAKGGHRHVLATTDVDHDKYCWRCKYHDDCLTDTNLYENLAHRAAGVPPAFLNAYLEEGDTEQQWRPILASVMAVLLSRWGNVVVTGDYGVGKTTIAAGIVRNVASPTVSCAWISGSSVAGQLRQLYAEHGTEATWRKPYIDARLLVIDGFAEPGTTQNAVRALEDIVLERYDAVNRPVLITTNLDAAGLKASVSAAVWDRLVQGSFHAVSGESHRRPLEL